MIPTIDFHGTQVSKIGLGLMSIVDNIYKGDLKEVPKVLDMAVTKGCTFWDTADVYGLGKSEEYAKDWVQVHRDRLFICTKFGLIPQADGGYKVNGTPEYVKNSCEGSLKRLGTDCIDLYYLHRVDPDTSIEETVKAMKELQDAGKIKHIGLSECSVDSLRRASKVAKIAAVQVEYSIFSPDIEQNGLLEACQELGVFVIAYSPVGRGLLTTTWKFEHDIPEGDFRKGLPRWQGDAFQANLRFVEAFKELASKKGCTANQLALSWIMDQPQTIPIPGTSHLANLEDNLGSVNVTITPDEHKAIRDLMQTVEVVGTRYMASMMGQVDV